MVFSLQVKPDNINHLDNGTEITTVIELKIDSEEYRREFEKDSTSLCTTMRQLMYMYYHPFGITWINGDDSFTHMYEMFCRREEVKSVTVVIKQYEFVEDSALGNNEFNVKCSYRLDMVEEQDEKYKG